MSAAKRRKRRIPCLDSKTGGEQTAALAASRTIRFCVICGQNNPLLFPPPPAILLSVLGGESEEAAGGGADRNRRGRRCSPGHENRRLGRELGPRCFARPVARP